MIQEKLEGSDGINVIAHECPNECNYYLQGRRCQSIYSEYDTRQSIYEWIIELLEVDLSIQRTGERIRRIGPSPSYEMANHLRTPIRRAAWLSKQIEAL
jgi:hypothetical protein